MSVRKLRPVTPGQRFRMAPCFSLLTKKKPERSLLVPAKSSGGRNSTGKMTVRNRGGGHKRMIRIIDFKRSKFDVAAMVKAIEYDPMRTAYIALLFYEDGQKSYILAPDGLKIGSKVMAGIKASPDIGNALPIKLIPSGTMIHNIETIPGRGGVMARSAGTYAQLLVKNEKHVTIGLPSGEKRMVLGECMATVGVVSNATHMNVTLGKAGRSRWMGRKPRVRGVAMNPVDHPMGGGEGKASGGHPRSRKGLCAKGLKTRNRKKYSKRMIIVGRKK